jgi:hypothetical protein
MNINIPSVRATDQAFSSLLEWGIGGAILAVFVAPTFWAMVRAGQKREEERAARDARDADLRNDRETKVITALVASVEQQRQALENWKQYETQEEKVHSALLAGLSQVTSSLGEISNSLRVQQREVAVTATYQDRIATLLEQVAKKIQP